MTTSRNRKTRLGRGRPPVRLFGAVLLCIVLAGAVAGRAYLSGALWRVLAPLMHGRDALTLSQSESLKAQLASTTAALADRDALYRENLDLKARLGRDGSVHTVLAGVLERPPQAPYDTLVIDAGSESGVAAGDPVAAAGTALIGTVLQVYPTASRVELFSAPGASYNALLRGSIPVSIQGQGAGSLVTQVPAGTPVSVGDAVIFPGIAGGYAGSVSHVDAPEGNSFEIIYLHLPVDPLSLRYVEVWKQHAQ